MRLMIHIVQATYVEAYSASAEVIGSTVLSAHSSRPKAEAAVERYAKQQDEGTLALPDDMPTGFGTHDYLTFEIFDREIDVDAAREEDHATDTG